MDLPPIATTDYHSGGEPFRIVPEPPVALCGDTVADRRVRAMADPSVQDLRRILCHEPRGHADMYGGFIVPPDDAGADLGVLFWHKDGFSTACGHGTIALGTWAVDGGLVHAPDTGTVDVIVDVPSGRVTARVVRNGGRTVGVEFVNVPSFVLARQVSVRTSRGEVSVDVSFGGAVYAQVPAAALGLAVAPKHVHDLIAVGREVKWALDGTEHAAHPTDPRLSGVYGTILFDHLGDGDDGRVHQRNVAIFADGQVDRSPCGSGTAARMATLAADGRLDEPGAVLVHSSIVGSMFMASILDRVTVEGCPAVVPAITGTAFRTGEHVFHVDPHDDLLPGFVLR
jgi:proline racemase